MLTRRSLLQAAAALPVAALAPAWATGDGLVRTPFGSAPELQPLRGWLDGQDRLAEGLRLQGRWPAELRGTLYRNGPGLMERAGQRYRHWFDGDGLVQAWQLGAQGFSHQARFVRTPKFVAEQEAGEFLLPAFGTAVPAKRPLRRSDDVNTANTSVMLQGGRLYALWEGGSATELDPQSLHTKGLQTWAPELQGMPFSAHPKREPDGRLWNFGSFGGKLVIYEIDAAGGLKRWKLLDMAVPAMLHDFVITERFLVFLLPPLRLDLAAVKAGRSMVGAMRWQAEQGNRVLVIDKADLSVRAQLQMPAELVFHFGNAWDDGQGVIRLDYVHGDIDEFLDGRFNSVVQGQRPSSVGESGPRLLRIDLPRQRLDLVKREETTEFPQVDPRVVARRYRYVYAPARHGRAPGWGFNAVQRLDLERGAVERFVFPSEVVIEEQLLVPKPGSRREGQGWLLGTGFDVARQRSFCTVFDAEALSAGPLATVWLPYWVPLGFHGAFVPA
ncbi:carotenoid oxygenase family protein [Inhella proteolytica]|uniref:Carotenoid oxygenase family protein n=1 Tax=Inhella proteolytica TaxID=2795029 RepID=A0A931NG41_9BURK|nr:carotenoid oxygenase family protein [Inhella proteolytica]MBH9576303.1 carotenoid oxygenase family protein [Inhella proteolytica]